MKHIARIFLFAVLVPLLLVSCKGKGFQDIAITSVRLVSIVPEGFNPFRLLRLLGDEASFEDITFDVRGRVSLRSGFGRNIEMLDIPLSSLLGAQTNDDEQTLE